MVKVLSDDERRQMILETLEDDSNITEIAKRYGVNRRNIYHHLERVFRDPKQKMLDAKAEAAALGCSSSGPRRAAWFRPLLRPPRALRPPRLPLCLPQLACGCAPLP